VGFGVTGVVLPADTHIHLERQVTLFHLVGSTGTTHEDSTLTRERPCTCSLGCQARLLLQGGLLCLPTRTRWHGSPGAALCQTFTPRPEGMLVLWRAVVIEVLLSSCPRAYDCANVLTQLFDARTPAVHIPDFSVVPFRPNFMLASEEYPHESA